MIYPTTERELELWKDGFEFIGGIDEAGRGAWAGPVVAAVVVWPKGKKSLPGITDSKLLSPKKRDEFFDIIISESHDYGVGIVDHLRIDEIGILNATKEASKLAVDGLKKLPDYLLCDALDLSDQIAVQQEAIIKGDQKVYSISCASILAKVTRDRLMSELPERYSKYEFDKHKGYGTALHQEKLQKHSISDIHRKSYRPIRAYLDE